MKDCGISAKKTIDELWNEDNAANELVRFCKEFYEGKRPMPSSSGPISIASVIKAPGITRSFREKNVLE